MKNLNRVGEFMHENSKNISRIYSHALFWSIYYGIEFCLEINDKIYTKTSIIRYFLGIILFYSILKILRKDGFLKKNGQLILSFLLFLLVSLIIKYGALNLFQKFTNPPITTQILYVIDNFAHVFLLAFIYNIYQKLKENHLKSIEIENQLFDLETKYLNSKVDTHFFMNSINLFYVHFLKNESETAQKLIKLSDFVKKNL